MKTPVFERVRSPTPELVVLTSRVRDLSNFQTHHPHVSSCPGGTRESPAWNDPTTLGWNQEPDRSTRKSTVGSPSPY